MTYPLKGFGNSKLVYYAYDNRTQYDEPVFVVYDRDHVQKVTQALYGETPEWLLVSTRRLHPWNPNESYRGRTSKGK
jgi:hypothetical protein